jgi:hypothetical protein
LGLLFCQKWTHPRQNRIIQSPQVSSRPLKYVCIARGCRLNHLAECLPLLLRFRPNDFLQNESHAARSPELCNFREPPIEDRPGNQGSEKHAQKQNASEKKNRLRSWTHGSGVRQHDS